MAKHVGSLQQAGSRFKEEVFTCQATWEFPTMRGTLFWGPLIIRILLFRVLYSGPLFF